MDFDDLIANEAWSTLHTQVPGVPAEDHLGVVDLKTNNFHSSIIGAGAYGGIYSIKSIEGITSGEVVIKLPHTVSPDSDRQDLSFTYQCSQKEAFANEFNGNAYLQHNAVSEEFQHGKELEKQSFPSGKLYGLQRYQNEAQDVLSDFHERDRLEHSTDNLYSFEGQPLGPAIYGVGQVDGVSGIIMDKIPGVDIESLGSVELMRLFPDKESLEYGLNQLMAVAQYFHETFQIGVPELMVLTKDARINQHDFKRGDIVTADPDSLFKEGRLGRFHTPYEHFLFSKYNTCVDIAEKMGYCISKDGTLEDRFPDTKHGYIRAYKSCKLISNNLEEFLMEMAGRKID